MSCNLMEGHCLPKDTSQGGAGGVNTLMSLFALLSYSWGSPFAEPNWKLWGKESIDGVLVGQLPKAKAGCRRVERRLKGK